MSSDWRPGTSGSVRVALFDAGGEQWARLDDAGLLSAEEEARAARFRGAILPRRYRRAHAALRLLLAHELGCGVVSLPPFEFGERGKPRLRGGGLEFNLSHSGSLVAVAMARGRQVGVDVEAPGRAGADFQAIAGQVFHDEEAALVSTSAPVETEAMFLRLWTAREAYLKARGSGLAAPDRTFNAAPLVQGVQAVGHDGWLVRQVAAPEGVFAAVAARGAGWGVELVAPQLALP